MSAPASPPISVADVLERLAERDIETMHALAYCNDRYERGAKPLDLGGGSRSHHSGTLAKLAKRGLVLKKNWAIKPDGSRDGVRGSCLYWITDFGREVLAAAKARSPHVRGDGE